MTEKINLAAKLALLDKPYQPGIVGYVNDYKLQVVKVKGPFVWQKMTRPTTSSSCSAGSSRSISGIGMSIWNRARYSSCPGEWSTVPTPSKRPRFC